MNKIREIESRFIVKVTDTKTNKSHEEWITTTDINSAMKEYEELHFDKLGHCEWEIVYEYRSDRI